MTAPTTKACKGEVRLSVWLNGYFPKDIGNTGFSTEFDDSRAGLRSRRSPGNLYSAFLLIPNFEALFFKKSLPLRFFGPQRNFSYRRWCGQPEDGDCPALRFFRLKRNFHSRGEDRLVNVGRPSRAFFGNLMLRATSSGQAGDQSGLSDSELVNSAFRVQTGPLTISVVFLPLLGFGQACGRRRRCEVPCFHVRRYPRVDP